MTAYTKIQVLVKDKYKTLDQQFNIESTVKNAWIQFFPEKYDNVAFIKNEEVIFSCPSAEAVKHCELDYDLVIYSPIHTNTNDRVVIIKRDPEYFKTQMDSGLDCKASDARFIFAEIIFYMENGTTYPFKVEFKTDKYNYMIANNTFNYTFIRYFLKKHYSWEIFHPQLILDDYTIKIIDNDVNIVYIDKTKHLHFTETGYSIITE